MNYIQPPVIDFHNINYNLSTVFRHRVHKDQWGDDHFVPYLNKLYLILEGQLSFMINDTSFTASKGDLLLLPLHTCQTYHVNSDYFDHYYCHFLMTMDNHNLDLFDRIHCPYNLHLDDTQYTYFIDLFDTLTHTFSQGPSVIHTLKSYDLFNHILLTYFDMIQNDIISIEPQLYLTQMFKVMDYIKQNMHRQLTVEEMANKLHLHPNYFIRLFKKHYGMAPIQYINTIKIKKACEQLLLGRDAISHIATSLGYSDIYYFSRLFKKHMGVSPTGYRWKHNPNI